MYITKEDLQAQWITWTPAYLDSLVARSESIFNVLIDNEYWIMKTEITEVFQDIHWCDTLKISYHNPTTLTTINGSTVPVWEYYFIWNKLLLKNAVSVIDDFPNTLTLVYEAWYTKVPADVQQVCISLAGYLDNTKKASGISSFSQDLLTVSYGSKEVYNYLESLGQMNIISKYKRYYVSSL